MGTRGDACASSASDDAVESSGTRFQRVARWRSRQNSVQPAESVRTAIAGGAKPEGLQYA